MFCLQNDGRKLIFFWSVPKNSKQLGTDQKKFISNNPHPINGLCFFFYIYPNVTGLSVLIRVN